MGGLGSGPRPRIRQSSPVVEVTPQVDFQHLYRDGHLAAGMSMSQTFQPSRSRPQAGLTMLTMAVSCSIVVAVLTVVSADDAHRMECFEMPLRLRPSSLGEGRGVLAVVGCPGCDRWCRILFIQDTRLACRRCHGLLYRAQRQGKLHRSRAQYGRLLAALDTDDIQGKPLHRPKGMRGKRFARLAAHAQRIRLTLEIEEGRQTASLDRFLDRQERQLKSWQERLPTHTWKDP